MNSCKNGAMAPVFQDDHGTLLEYKPSLTRPLAGNEPMGFVRRVRFLLEYLGKDAYLVYCYAVKGQIVGYCVAAPGGRRLKCSTKKDVVIGPYYINPEHRGLGYGKQMLAAVLQCCGYDYEAAYLWIAKDNVPSARTARACGFEECGQLWVSRYLRRLVSMENGTHIVYRYSGQKQEAQ